ncbi:MAG: hydrogenase maturation protease [Pirellulales bacterium]|nr:hydrogenase maturation protease [Pirellulales bacterium]
MPEPRILIAGIGNIFLGDDAFGVEVVAALARHTFPDTVRVVDFGIRGLELAFALLDGYDTVILVDAMPRRGTPGQVYLVEVERDERAPSSDPSAPLFDMHRLDPAKVLRLVPAMGGRLGRLFVVGCEPVPLDTSEVTQPGLSAAARAAIPVAVEIICQLVQECHDGAPTGASNVERVTV